MNNFLHKKKKALLLSALVLGMSTQALAATVNDTEIDLETDVVTISGNVSTKNNKATLIVLNPNGKLTDLATDSDALQYKRIIATDENGDFTHSFKLSLDDVNDTGVYKIYVGERGESTNADGEFYFASENDIKSVVSQITSATSATEITTILSNEEDAKKLSVTQFKPFSEQEKSKIATVMFAKLQTWTTDNKNNCTGAEMQSFIYECSIVSAFNNGNKALVIDNDGNFLYENILNITKMDTEKDITLVDVYNTLISDEGKALVRDSLFNKNYKDLDDLKKELATQIVLKGIAYPKKNGFSHVSTILSDKNNAYVGITLNITLTDNEAITLKDGGPYETVTALQTKINSLRTGNTPGSNVVIGNTGTVSNGSTSGSSSMGNISYKPSKDDTANNSVTNKKFNDLANYAWAENAIYNLTEKGILNGVSENEFAPEQNLTREQAVKMICLAKGISATANKGIFTDVDENAWYAGFVNSAYEKGIVNGLTDTTFGVGTEISRQDFAVMIVRAFGLTTNSGAVSFADFDSISDYAKEAVQILGSKGIITGFSDNTFKPFNNCTRAEASVIINRVLGGSN